MVLQLPDPINVKNNVGNLADASALQKIFKVSYILLHTRGVIERLNLMFEGREIFMWGTFRLADISDKWHYSEYFNSQ